MSDSALNPQSPDTRHPSASVAEKVYASLFVFLIAGTLIARLVFLGWLASRVI
jgi:hypothetical protein